LEAIDDFVSRGYCDDSDRDAIHKWFITGMNSPEEVSTSWNLMYNFKDGTYDFWSSDAEYDFGYSIETHEMSLNS